MKKVAIAILLMCCTHVLHAQLLPVHTVIPPTNHSGLRTTSGGADYADAPAFPNPTTSAVWHTAIGDNDSAEDWLYSMVETNQKNLIAVGYSGDTSPYRYPTICKMNSMGQLLWIQRIPQPVAATGSFPYMAHDSTGAFIKVIKAPGNVANPNGIYIAVGYIYQKGTYNKYMLITEFNDDGHYIVPPTVFYPSTSYITGSTTIPVGDTIFVCNANSVALDPVQNSANALIVCGVADYANSAGTSNFGAAFITTVSISGTTVTSGQTFVGGNAYTKTGNLDNSLVKVITNKTGASTYDIYSCGYISASASDDSNYSAHNANDTTHRTYTSFDKDGWLVKLQMSGTTLSLTHQWQFNKSNIVAGPSSAALNSDNTYESTALYPYQEHGPCTARNFFPKTGGTPMIGNSPATTAFTAPHNRDERATDMILGTNDSIDIIIQVNNIGNSSNGYDKIDNGVYLIKTQNANAGGQGIVGGYGEYRDCDAFLVKVAPTNYTSGISYKGQNVAHFSGTDFTPNIIQDNMKRYIIGGSTADTFFSSTDPNLPVTIADVNGDGENGFLVYTDDYHATDIWRRSYVANDSREGINNEDCFCLFCMAPTADDGYVVAGNNDNRGNDFSITKFAPLNENPTNLPSGTISYATFSQPQPPKVYTLSAGTTTWSSNMNIASLVIVPSGATLNINNCTIQFASSRNVYDFSQFPSANDGRIYGAGILVEPGGRVNIKSDTLRGLNFAQTLGTGTDRNMWDGIVVQGTPTMGGIPYQGDVTVSHSVIQDAVYGFYVAENYRAFTDQGVVSVPGFKGENYTANYNGYGTLGGGIVAADTSTFLDNRFGFTFQGYTGANGSIFKGCTFNTDTKGMGDICLYTDASGNNIPANTYGSSWEGRIVANDDTFTCATSFPAVEWPIGLVGSDAALTVTRSCNGIGAPGTCPSPGPGNTFSNLTKGIVIGSNVAQGSAGTRITYNTFNNNSINSIAATSIMSSMQISNNNVNTPTTTYSVLLVGCVGYDVSLNTFNEYSGTTTNDYGVVVNNGSTTDNEIVENNYFTNYTYPCIALGSNGGVSNNDGLQFHCNTFGPFSYTGVGRLTIAGGAPGTLNYHQGGCISGSLTSPAGNQFPSTCYSSNNDRLWADAGSATNQPTVFYNYNQSGTVFDPTGCYRTTQYSPVSCGTGAGNDSASITAACPPPATNYTLGDFTAMKAATLALETAIGLLDSVTDSNTYHTLVFEHSLDVSYVARYYSFEAQYDSGGMWLEHYDLYAQALSFYLEANDTAAASRMERDLGGGGGSRLTGNGTTDADGDQQYATLAAITMNLRRNGEGMAYLDSDSRNILKSIAQYNSIAGYMAAFADTLLGTGPMLWPVPGPIDSDNADAARSTQQQSGTFNMPPVGNFSVYPNPSTGTLTINATTGGSFSLYTIMGQQVALYTAIAGQTTVALPSNLSDGIYMGIYKPGSGGLPSEVRIVLAR